MAYFNTLFYSLLTNLERGNSTRRGGKAFFIKGKEPDRMIRLFKTQFNPEVFEIYAIPFDRRNLDDKIRLTSPDDLAPFIGSGHGLRYTTSNNEINRALATDFLYQIWGDYNQLYENTTIRTVPFQSSQITHLEIYIKPQSESRALTSVSQYKTPNHILMSFVQACHYDLHEYISTDPFNAKAFMPHILSNTKIQLERLHAHNIQHYDIKPENIVICPYPGGGFISKIIDYPPYHNSEEKQFCHTYKKLYNNRARLRRHLGDFAYDKITFDLMVIDLCYSLLLNIPANTLYYLHNREIREDVKLNYLEPRTDSYLINAINAMQEIQHAGKKYNNKLIISDERIHIFGRIRRVYIGPRGGKYVKCNNKYRLVRR